MKITLISITILSLAFLNSIHAQSPYAFEGDKSFQKTFDDYMKNPSKPDKSKKYLLKASKILKDDWVYDPTIRFLNKAIQADSTNIPARLLAGSFYDFFQEFDNSLREYNAVITIDPTNCEVIAAKGITLLNMGKFDDALSCLNKGIASCPSPLAYAVRGSFFRSKNMLENEINDYSMALTLDSLNSVYYENLVIIYDETNQPNECLKMIDRIIRNKTYLRNLHLSFEYRYRAKEDIILGNYIAALADLKFPMGKRGGNPEDYEMRGIAKFYLGDYIDALHDFKITAKNTGYYNNWSIDSFETTYKDLYLFMAKADTALNQYPEALDALLRSIKEKKEPIPAYDLRGDIYFKLGKKEEACREWKEALKQNPQFKNKNESILKEGIRLKIISKCG